MKPLLIYGAGGFAREVLELVRDINRSGEQWDVLGFLSDDADSWGRVLNDVPILGGEPELEKHADGIDVVLGIGSPAAKRKIVERLRKHRVRWPSLVHPNVVMSSFVDLGDGVVITAGNVLTANIKLGDFAMVNLACTVGHDCLVGRYSTISPGVNVSGHVRLGDGCDIGTGSSFVQGVSLGEWSIVGAGAVVSKDLPPNCTAVGVPARVIKERDPGWHLA
jgi:sugar O-acyltransferase (sialic acid O-acetyltransferase NeuD family)